MGRRALSFTKLYNDCWVCDSHCMNQDGYIRLAIGNPHDRRMYMLHRAVYEAKNGKLPEGYEIDHLCGCRQCSNPEHLVAKKREQHVIHTNKSRYHERQMQARIDWEEHGRKITGTALAAKFNVSFSNACRWIRDWKKQTTLMVGGQ